MRTNPTLFLWGLCLSLGCTTGLLAAGPEQVTLETSFLRFQISPENGRFEIGDNSGGVTWQSNPYQARFGEITWTAEGKQRRADLGRCQITWDEKLQGHPERAKLFGAINFKL